MNNQEFFFKLIRLGIGTEISSQVRLWLIHKQIDWKAVEALALQQGLSAIMLDGIEKLSEDKRPPQILLLQWIGESMQLEIQYAAQQKASEEMAALFYQNNIRTYVLKGFVISECYPTPEHRTSVDMDCYLLPSEGDFYAWELGNDLMKESGYDVKYDYYKNSTFMMPDLIVENHKFMVPFRGNKVLTQLEKMLQGLLREDEGEDKIEGTHLYRPPVMVSALFLIEHAYSHFLHEGLTWRHVLDWIMFRKKHENDIVWDDFYFFVKRFGLKKFYNSYVKLGKLLLGEITEEALTKPEKKMLEDVWAPLDVHETVHGLRGKLALCGNTWRARWKYKYFADISMLHALWIQIKGFLFIKEPKLI